MLAIVKLVACCGRVGRTLARKEGNSKRLVLVSEHVPKDDGAVFKWRSFPEVQGLR